MNGENVNTWSREAVFDFLTDEPRIGRLATVTIDGNPHVVRSGSGRPMTASWFTPWDR